MSLIEEKELRDNLDRFLSNHICSASPALTDLGRLHKATMDELLEMAKKYKLLTEDGQWKK